MSGSLQGKRALVVGLARSGVAAARLLAREGADVVATDRRRASQLAKEIEALLPLGVRFELGGHDPSSFLDADLVVVSPGVPLAMREIASAREAGVRVVGEVELAASFVREPIVGVTGTNGKSTTTALVAHLLGASGRRVFAGGNLGVPLSERALAAPDPDVSVVELSSYQLEGIDRLRPHVSIFTNLAPDHLDRYESVQHYWDAKRAIFRNQGEEDFAVLNGDDPEVLRLFEGSRPAPFLFSCDAAQARGASVEEGGIVVRGLPGQGGEERYAIAAPSLRGAHGRKNAMAAILASRLLGAGPRQVQEALETFPGLPHRLQSVRIHRGVEWINDSKATNVEAAEVALSAFGGPLIWIAGGKGKGAPYRPLRSLLQGRVRLLLTIGEDGDRIAAELGDLVEVVRCGALPRAVEVAAARARGGEAVLFSPACASFDQFRDFEHRGETFAALVEGLP